MDTILIIRQWGMSMKLPGFIMIFIYFMRSFLTGVPRFFKYQVVTKLLFSALIMPLFWFVAQFLMDSRGMSAVSNSQLVKFILSPQGVGFLILVIALVVLGILIELCGFITISAQLLNKAPESSYIELLKFNFKQLPRMLEVGSLFLLLYILLLAPMTGAGFSLSFFDQLEIPNFIDSVIEESLLYLSLYFVVIAVMIYFSVRWIFVFHFMVIARMRPSQAMRASAKLIKRNFKLWLKEFFSVAFVLAVAVGGTIVMWLLFILLLSEATNFNSSASRILLFFLLLVQHAVTLVFGLLIIPFEVHQFTIMFYKFVEKDPEFADLRQVYPQISAKSKQSFLDRLLARRKTWGVALVSLMLLVAVPSGLFFEEIVQKERQIEIVGHRGGGFGAPENTLAGIQFSIDQGAQWVEIDVQRSKDGFYILNHDQTFKRVAGVAEETTALTLAQIRSLRVGASFGEEFKDERVPTLEEVLDYCKDKIGIKIELKGKSADLQMVRDVVAMVAARQMEDQIILISLDYNLIEQIEDLHPEMQTGFIFFLAVGKIGTLRADYLILEEREAKDKTLYKIRQAGKKIVVWTVNTPEGMQALLDKDIDAVITDDVVMVRDVLAKQAELSEKEMLMELFFKLED
jgi:glycerophosphoryl diester phosphodiesterase